MFSSKTGKLPKGQSFVLKPSALEAALSEAGITIDTSVDRIAGSLFDVHFWPPNPNVPHERLYIRMGSVPYERASIVRSYVEEIVIPGIVAWIGDILSKDVRSPIRREQQVISITLPTMATDSLQSP